MATTWILLRGLVREQAHWKGFAERLAESLGARLGEGHRVLCLDLPGNGELHHQRSPTRVSGMVDRAREHLAALGEEGPIRLVALSLGGMVAMDWLRRHPEQVSAVALINSSAAPVSPFWRRLRPANYGPILFQGLLTRDRLRRERMILALTTNLLSVETREQVAREFADISRAHPVSVVNTLRQFLAAIRFRAPAVLPENRPVLIISAQGDRLVSPSCSMALATHWDRRLISHSRAGHDLSLDDPEWLAATLAAWAADQDERPAIF